MAKKQVVIPIFIPHQGCPHRCYFCDQRQSSGSKSVPERGDIVQKIEDYLKHIPKSVERIEVAFFGGSFTGLESHLQNDLLSIAFYYIKKKLIHGIRLSTRPDYINNEKLDLLKRYGVTMIELGIQSFSDDVLRMSNRGHSADDSIRAVRAVKKLEFEFIIQLMPGLPGDTREISISSAIIARDMSPSGVRVYPAVVLKNTELMNLYEKNLYTPLTMEEAIELCKDIHLIMKEKNIPVIRTGLHPFTEDAEKNIAAGPYHPSFGYFVKTRIRRDMMERVIGDFISNRNLPDERLIILFIPSKFKEEYLGFRLENIEYLKKKFSLERLDYRFVEADEVGVKIV